MDGLSHCLEVLYGAVGKPVPLALDEPRNPQAREALCLATDLGGYAIMLGGTNGAHLTSFSLVDILSHGRACAILNPYYTVFFAPAIEQPLKEVGRIYQQAGLTEAPIERLGPHRTRPAGRQEPPTAHEAGEYAGPPQPRDGGRIHGTDPGGRPHRPPGPDQERPAAGMSQHVPWHTTTKDENLAWPGPTTDWSNLRDWTSLDQPIFRVGGKCYVKAKSGLYRQTHGPSPAPGRLPPDRPQPQPRRRTRAGRQRRCRGILSLRGRPKERHRPHHVARLARRRGSGLGSRWPT